MNKYDGLATRVKNARKQAGLSQEKLAQMVDVSSSTIRNLERGENQGVSLWTIVDIAAVTNTRINEIIHGYDYEISTDDIDIDIPRLIFDMKKLPSHDREIIIEMIENLVSSSIKRYRYKRDEKQVKKTGSHNTD